WQRTHCPAHGGRCSGPDRWRRRRPHAHAVTPNLPPGAAADWQQTSAGSPTGRLRVCLVTALGSLIGFSLPVYGHGLGLPEGLHPDEVTRSAERMVEARSIDPGRYAYGALPRFLVIGGAIVPARLYSRAFDPQPSSSDRLAQLVWRARTEARIVRGARVVTACF